ncbi:MAG: acyl-ACP thioesterase [Desulfuromonas sp.]|nr:MAG: acyl-ACP thioesterase [Desulfuromonas sp.]
MTIPNHYQADYTVRSYEVDTDGRVRPLTLLNYLQDAAGEHASRLGASVPALLKMNLTWVLSRYHVHFHRFVPVHSTIHLKTWPSAKEGRFALRDFELVDGDGNPVVTATSSWMLIDLTSRRPVRIADHLPDLPTVERRMVHDSFSSLPIPDRFDCELPFRVRHSDLDINRHVNNTVYVDWALEALPPSDIGRYRPRTIEVSYRAEANYGDRILSKTQFSSEPEPISLHQLRRESDDREVARLRIFWSRI